MLVWRCSAPAPGPRGYCVALARKLNEVFLSHDRRTRPLESTCVPLPGVWTGARAVHSVSVCRCGPVPRLPSPPHRQCAVAVCAVGGRVAPRLCARWPVVVDLDPGDNFSEISLTHERQRHTERISNRPASVRPRSRPRGAPARSLDTLPSLHPLPRKRGLHCALPHRAAALIGSTTSS